VPPTGVDGHGGFNYVPSGNNCKTLRDRRNLASQILLSGTMKKSCEREKLSISEEDDPFILVDLFEVEQDRALDQTVNKLLTNRRYAQFKFIEEMQTLLAGIRGNNECFFKANTGTGMPNLYMDVLAIAYLEFRFSSKDQNVQLIEELSLLFLDYAILFEMESRVDYPLSTKQLLSRLNSWTWRYYYHPILKPSDDNLDVLTTAVLAGMFCADASGSAPLKKYGVTCLSKRDGYIIQELGLAMDQAENSEGLFLKGPILTDNQLRVIYQKKKTAFLQGVLK
jgi:hypothetical protein